MGPASKQPRQEKSSSLLQKPTVQHCKASCPPGQYVFLHRLKTQYCRNQCILAAIPSSSVTTEFKFRRLHLNTSCGQWHPKKYVATPIRAAYEYQSCWRKLFFGWSLSNPSSLMKSLSNSVEIVGCMHRCKSVVTVRHIRSTWPIYNDQVPLIGIFAKTVKTDTLRLVFAMHMQ